MQKLKVGTLIRDNSKLGIITKVIDVGTLNTKVDLIKWRANYEIHYTDGVVSILGCTTVERLVKEEKIAILYTPTTPLPPSSSSDEALREKKKAEEKNVEQKIPKKATNRLIDPELSKTQKMIYFLWLDEQIMNYWSLYLDMKCSLPENALWTNKDMVALGDYLEVIEYFEKYQQEITNEFSYEEIDEFVRNNPHLCEKYKFFAFSG